MKKRVISNLMWVSLGVHVVYFILLGYLVMGQRQIFKFSSPIRAPYLFSMPALMAGAFLFLAIHAALTILLVKQLNTGGCSVSGEAAGALVLGVGFPVAYEISEKIGRWLAGFYVGIEGLFSYSMFTEASRWISPIRVIAVSLVLLAIGMSIYCKRSDSQKTFETAKWIKMLLWWSFGLDAAFFLVAMSAAVFQIQIKDLINIPDIIFGWPAATLVGTVALLAVHLALTLLLNQQLKEGGGRLVWEILGVLLFCGVLEWIGEYVNMLAIFFAARRGSEVVSNYSTFKSVIDFFGFLQAAGANLFILCCGLMICKIRKENGFGTDTRRIVN